MAKKKLPKPPFNFGFGPNVKLIHVGRKAPSGYVESGPAIHLGRGVWIIPIEPEPETVQPVTRNA